MPTNWEVIPFFFFVAFWIIIYLNRNYYKFHIEYYISQLMILCQKRSTESQASLKNYEREGASGWGTHVNPRLIHVNVWQKPLQYCKVISLQLIKMKKIMEKQIILLYKNTLHLWWLFLTHKGEVRGETRVGATSCLWSGSPAQKSLVYTKNSHDSNSCGLQQKIISVQVHVTHK